jgi:hypothetical protein
MFNLTEAIAFLESTLNEYRLTPADVEQAKKDVVGLKPGQVKALLGLVKFYGDPATRKIEVSWLLKQQGVSQADLDDLAAKKYIQGEPARSPKVYSLTLPKGLVVALALRDDKVSI